MTDSERPVENKQKKADRNHNGQFLPGQTGNPRGRAKGDKNRATLLAEKILEDDREAIVRAVVNAAKNGDPTAMRLCIERLVPLRKGGRPIVFDMPKIETPADVVSALGALTTEMAAGELTIDEAAGVAGVIDLRRKALETNEIEERLRRLEEKAK
jgi:Family of unknown function (DUF5681)